VGDPGAFGALSSEENLGREDTISVPFSRAYMQNPWY
jgi:hypothetical protein